MNKDIRKYIANCTLSHKEKAEVQAYPLQMTDIPDRPFNKIAIDTSSWNAKPPTQGINTSLQQLITLLVGQKPS